MGLVHLVFHPRAFFREHGESLGWASPLAGFYLFAFAMYFQNYLVPGYHIPFYLVVYVAAWFPTLMVAAGLVIVLVLFWYWPASMALSRESGFARGVKVVGISLLPPAVLFCAVLLVLAVLNSNDVAMSYRAVVIGVHSVAGLWALALITVGAMVANDLTPLKTVLFVLWLVLLFVLLGAVVYAIVNNG
jgi:hypothetical protein